MVTITAKINVSHKVPVHKMQKLQEFVGIFLGTDLEEKITIERETHASYFTYAATGRRVFATPAEIAPAISVFTMSMAEVADAIIEVVRSEDVTAAFTTAPELALKVITIDGKAATEKQIQGLNLSIKEAEFRTRTRNFLNSHRIRYLGELVVMAEGSGSLRMEKFGPASLKNTKEVLSWHDLNLTMKLEGWDVPEQA